MCKELIKDDAEQWYFSTWQNIVRTLVNAVGQSEEESTATYTAGINLATMA